MKKTILILSILLLICAASSFAQNHAGTVAAPWLKIAPDARAIGFGGSVVASVNDATALYWNPAGTAKMEKMGVHFTHTQWLFEVDYNFGAVAVPTENGTFGFSFINLASDEEEVTTIEFPNGTGEKWGMGWTAIGFSYSDRFTDKFSFGVNLKYIYETLWNMSRSAVAVDMGMQYDTGIEGIKVGMSINNIGTEMEFMGGELDFDHDPLDNETDNHATYKATPDDLPVIFRFGFSWEAYNDGQNMILTSASLEDPYDVKEVVCFGMEYGFNEMVFLRGGYKYSDQSGVLDSYSLGGGINYEFTDFGLAFNYSYAPMENDDVDFEFDAVHRYSLDFSF